MVHCSDETIQFQRDPLIVVNTDVIDFGQTELGETKTRKLMFTNPGLVTLAISSLEFKSDDDSVFSLSEETLSVSFDDSGYIEISFQPTEEKMYQAWMTIKSNARNAPEITVELLGIGFVTNQLPSVVASIIPEVPTTEDVLTVSATVTDPDQDTVSLSYLWTRDGMPVPLVNSSIPAEQTSKGERWKVEVTPTDGKDDGDTVEAVITIVNAPPRLDEVEIGPALARVDDVITSTLGIFIDPDEDEVFFEYQWLIDSVVIVGQASDTLPAAIARRAQTIQLVVTPKDNEESGVAVYSNILTVGNSRPEITKVMISPANGNESTVFTCTAMGWTDSDSDMPDYEIAWFVDSSTVNVTSATLDGISFDRGNDIGCRMTPTDGIDSGTPRYSQLVRIENAAPSITGVTITPTTAFELSVLSASVSGWMDLDNDSPAFQYAWHVDGSLVGNSETIDGALFNRDQEVTVTVAPFDGYASGVALTSVPVRIRNSLPSTGNPQIQPAILTDLDDAYCVPQSGMDDDNDRVSMMYEWYIQGTSIGVNSSTLSESYFVELDEVQCEVTPFDGMDYGMPMRSGIVTTASVSNPQCSIVDQPVFSTNNLVSSSGDVAMITLGSSEVGTAYSLRNDSNNAVVDGPLVGTGSGLSFTTSPITSTTTFNVQAKKPSTALHFDGVDDYVNAGTGVDLANRSFTVEAWVKRESNNTRDFILGLGTRGLGNLYLHIGWKGNSMVFAFYGNDLATSPVYGDADWHHWAFTYDAATKARRIYRNGILVASDVASGDFRGTGDLRIGTTVFGNPLHGRIDDLRIWNLPRTQVEVQQDMKRCLSGTESGLVVFYNFEDGTGNASLMDRTGNGYDGALINMDASADWVDGSYNCSFCRREMTQKETIYIAP